jgi:glycosyltransferase involved in cell wall biosynthesis
VEAAALLEADFVQSVSASEAKFEIYNLLPLKNEVEAKLAPSRDAQWLAQQEWRNERFQEFLLLEPEDSVLFGKNAAGIPNGITLDEWKKLSRRDISEGKRLFSRLLPNQSQRVLFIGRTETRKGISALIEALALMRNDDVGLLLASSLNAESLEKYSRRIKELGLEDRVVVHDAWVDERKKMQLFCAADAIALPSFYEPFGIVTLEALAADMACENNGLTGPVAVVGDTGGMREIIRNGVNGFKVPMEEFDLKPALLGRVLDAALGDEEMRKKISRNGAFSVQSPVFDWKEIVSRTMGVYEKAISNHALLEKIGGEKMPTVDEKFGNEAGKVWLALKDSKPLSLQEIKRKAKLNDFMAGAGIGWLCREGKVRLEGKAGNKYALNE